MWSLLLNRLHEVQYETYSLRLGAEGPTRMTSASSASKTASKEVVYLESRSMMR
jgi:hypothetical protein